MGDLFSGDLFDDAGESGDAGPGRSADGTGRPPAGDAGHGHAPAWRTPLPVRMRPRSLDEVVGQGHLLTAGSPLRRLAEPAASEGGAGRAGVASVLLWGPPGTGKTTLAHVIARAGGRRFVELSAVTAGVRDVRRVMDESRIDADLPGRQTLLFLDEIHRFSKAQQDALLPGVENRWVVLVAATTENPSFSVIAPLLSRSLVLALHALSEADVRGLLTRAVADERGLNGQVSLTPQAEEHLVRLAGGDARRALLALEAAAGAALGATEERPAPVTAEQAEKALDAAAVRYDRAGDQHYDVASALIKSLRGSDVDAATHYLARMLTAGEDPRFIARRLVILASEDIGMADPTALQTAVAAMHVVAQIGMPEAQITLAQAVIHLALAPKSNASYRAVAEAMADVRAGRGGPVPAHLRDSHYAGASRLGHGVGYVYAHDQPRAVAAQQYPPDDLVGRDYYQPTDRGLERELLDRVARLRRVVRGTGREG